MKPLYRIVGPRKVHIPIPIWRTAVVTLQITSVRSVTYGVCYRLHDLVARIELPHIVAVDNVDAPLFTRSNHDVWEWTRRKGWQQSRHRRTKVTVISSQRLLVERGKEINFRKPPTTGRQLQVRVTPVRAVAVIR